MNDTAGTAPGDASVSGPSIDYVALFRRAPNPYVLLDPELRIIDMNEAYLAVTMSKREAIVRRNLSEALPNEGTVTEPSVALVRESLLKALQQGTVDHLAVVEYQIESPAGPERRVWSATHTPILDQDGRAVFVMQHTQDITEITRLRRRVDDRSPLETAILGRARAVQARNADLTAEASRLRTLFDQAPGFMAVLRGPDHVFEIANAAYLQLVGRRDIVGRSVADALPEIAGQGFIELLDEVRDTAKPFVGHGVTARLRRAPDAPLEELVLDLVYQPIVGDDGQVAGIFVQGHDITVQMRAESALRELNETLENRVALRTAELEQARAALESVNANLENIVAARMVDLQAANEEIQRFAYIVSHDLRSPLVNVMGFTSELESIRQTITDHFGGADGRALPETVRVAVEEDLPEAIAFIRSSTQRMDWLIGAILKLSREGRRVLQPELVPMRSLVEAFQTVLAHQLDEHPAVLDTRDMPDVVSDRMAIEQVFGNLVENAVKYLQPGKPGLIVVRGWEDGPNLHYAIVDNGRGIDPRDFDRIFDLFRRAGAQDVPGHGIGLAHTRALVRRLGGTITVSSEPGQGSTFVVTLPRVLTASNEEAA